MKSTSIKDIADSLSVSKTLVSLVLNNKGANYGISIQTQERVLEKAKELNYKPNRIAQGLRLGKSRSIGLIVPDISNPFYSKISRHISDFVDKQDYNLMIYNTDEDEQKEKKIIQTLLERHVDGIILTSTSIQPNDVKTFHDNHIPYVLVDRCLENIETNYVGINNYQSSYEAVDFLINKGAQKIAYISVGPLFISSLEDRKKGYKAALNDHQIKYKDEFNIIVSYNNIEEELSQKLDILFSQKEKPDALFIANNKLAIETLKKLKALNVSIPDDISIVSFDDIPLFDILPFPISTVAQPIIEICQKTTEILFKEINKKEGSASLKKENIILPGQLIKR
jgi:LacI family transcriptional regulator